MYEGISRKTQVFSKIMERMYSTQKIDNIFLALREVAADDYKVSDQALGISSNSFMFCIYCFK